MVLKFPIEAVAPLLEISIVSCDLRISEDVRPGPLEDFAIDDGLPIVFDCIFRGRWLCGRASRARCVARILARTLLRFQFRRGAPFGRGG